MSTRCLSEWRFNITVNVSCCVQVHCTPHSCCTTMKRGAAIQRKRVWGKIDELGGNANAQELGLNRTKKSLEGASRTTIRRETCRDPGLEQSLHKPLLVHWRDPERDISKASRQVIINRITSHRISTSESSWPGYGENISIGDGS